MAKVGGGSRVGVLTVRRREEERQQEMEEMEEKDCLSQWIFPEHLQYRNSEIVELTSIGVKIYSKYLYYKFLSYI